MDFISDYDKSQGIIQKERIGYFARLNVNGKTEICLVSGDQDIQTIDELIMLFGYSPESMINERVIISIEGVDTTLDRLKKAQLSIAKKARKRY